MSAQVTHTVQAGESLFSIAQRYGVTVTELQRANGITNPSLIRVGQRLIIPSKSPSTPPPAPTPPSSPTPLPTAPASPSPPMARLPEPTTSTRRYVFLDTVKDVIDSPQVTPNRWRYIVLHHSGTRKGNARIFDAAHRSRGMENGLAYHFVIGNGVDSGDGQIEVGRRWLKQIQGGHVKSEELNEISIGICFVGNFEETRPTKKQLAAAIELVGYLRQLCGPRTPRLVTHAQIHPQHTACPGKLFPASAFNRIFPDR